MNKKLEKFADLIADMNRKELEEARELLEKEIRLSSTAIKEGFEADTKIEETKLPDIDVDKLINEGDANLKNLMNVKNETKEAKGKPRKTDEIPDIDVDKLIADGDNNLKNLMNVKNETFINKDTLSNSRGTKRNDRTKTKQR